MALNFVSPDESLVQTLRGPFAGGLEIIQLYFSKPFFLMGFQIFE
jgi:hypothetical protein